MYRYRSSATSQILLEANRTSCSLELSPKQEKSKRILPPSLKTRAQQEKRREWNLHRLQQGAWPCSLKFLIIIIIVVVHFYRTKAKFDDGDDKVMMMKYCKLWRVSFDERRRITRKRRCVGLCVHVCGMDDGGLFLLGFCVPRSLVWAADHY
jgi:hypothetical protein